jgi:hypothetical protein
MSRRVLFGVLVVAVSVGFAQQIDSNSITVGVSRYPEFIAGSSRVRYCHRFRPQRVAERYCSGTARYRSYRRELHEREHVHRIPWVEPDPETSVDIFIGCAIFKAQRRGCCAQWRDADASAAKERAEPFLRGEWDPSFASVAGVATVFQIGPDGGCARSGAAACRRGRGLTVTATRAINVQPDQASLSVEVKSTALAGLDEIVGVLQGSGITAADLSFVYGFPPSWRFTRLAPFSKTQETITALGTLRQKLSANNPPFDLSFDWWGPSYQFLA